jgi:hypothetical protein
MMAAFGEYQSCNHLTVAFICFFDTYVMHFREWLYESSPVRENGAKTALVTKDGIAYVGGNNHGECWNMAVDQGKVKDDDLYNAKAAFWRPDGKCWDINGKDIFVKKIINLDNIDLIVAMS